MQIEIFSGKNNSGMAKKLVLLFFLSLFLSLPLKGQRQEPDNASTYSLSAEVGIR